LLSNELSLELESMPLNDVLNYRKKWTGINITSCL